MIRQSQPPMPLNRPPPLSVRLPPPSAARGVDCGAGAAAKNRSRHKATHLAHRANGHQVRDKNGGAELAKLDRFACLILDDIGYVQHDRDEMEVLTSAGATGRLRFSTDSSEAADATESRSISQPSATMIASGRPMRQ